RSAPAAAESEQLVEIGAHVRFRHPLVRSAAYAAGTPDDRCAVHSALAAATDAEAEPHRRLWHLASAATGPDETIALQLEQAAIAAQARAGSAAAAAFLERSAELTAEPNRRSERALAGAHAHMHAGAFESARALLAEAEAVATGDVRRARIERLRGQIEFAANPGAESPFLLVRAAKALEALDVGLARETYLEAWIASFVVGPVGRPGGLLLEVSMAARAAPPGQHGALACDLLLDAVATVVIDGLAEAAPLLRRAVDAFLSDEISDDELVQWGLLVTGVAAMLWDWQSWERLNTKYVKVARASGALEPLSIALNRQGHFATLCGDFEAATALFSEYEAVHEATGIGLYSVGRLLLAAYQGRPEAFDLVSDSADRTAGQGAQSATWTRAVLCNGLGRYSDALASAEVATRIELPARTAWALPELIEAAVRSGKPDVGRRAMEQLPKHTLDDSDWAVGIEARSRALVTEGEEAEQRYAEALEGLARTPFQTELARTHLLFGEWLRRQGRRVDAREQLHSAYDMFSTMGAEAFAERTRR
ncbi:MAG TPA: hypothetical protein VIX82_15600, partial [Solirubrobacteraceae bacterium]